MDYDEVAALRRHSPAWRLLRADHAPLVVSFLGRVFVDDNVRSLPLARLSDLLDDTLHVLNDRLGAGTFPRPAKSYLDDWAGPEAGWLRTYYPPGSDEAHVDATPALEKAVAWVRSLPQRSFIGTESRLNTAVELLRQIVVGSQADPQLRLNELLQRRAALDEEIERLRRGEVVVMEPAAVRDRYQQFAGTALGLLSDLREVEDNFRFLDRTLRERIATFDGSKGELLEEVLADRRAIAESDQGRTFRAFYDFLLSARRQEEFQQLLAQVQHLDVVAGAAEGAALDPRLRRIHHAWLEAGERTQMTVRVLSEQLRRFLDERAWLENRRVLDVLRSIESSALAVREHAAGAPGTEVDAGAPAVVLPMERPLFTPRPPLALDSTLTVRGEGGEAEDVDVAALFAQSSVDTTRLAVAVRRALQQRGQVALADVVAVAPLRQGLAEVLAYFALDDAGFERVFDPRVREQVHWDGSDGQRRRADLPRLVFVRRGAPAGAGRGGAGVGGAAAGAAAQEEGRG
ncbi:uncharacterized protein DUF3375 [Kineococcus xinjiangensis]|uniref:Uncharacterized protein DUF3375 n=1 Tax=Kineococcus xinjiangensis TaxID=512762 RepID=A0A2S6IPR3_9ACTN|nr:DUF3375 domain-containing protein [Kineococcus xinjiangensis]PPK96161.1 uncharacterized protein DUF3375 [Kineococcus xinjiangensis]